MAEIEINYGGDMLRAQIRPPDRAVVRMHRRGHHVQKAHGRRVTLATDNSHQSGGMIALMPTAVDAKRLALKGGEAAAELHCTLLFLGDDGSVWTEEQRDALQESFTSVIAENGLSPIQANVFGAAHWNGNGDKPSWVWSVGDNPDREPEDSTLEEARWTMGDAFGMAMAMTDGELPEPPVQHSPWVAHVCAAYTDDLTLVRELEKRLGPVTFDRIRLSFGDDDRDIPLSGTAVNLTAAGLRRDVLPHEDAVDFAEHNRQWEGAVDSTANRLSEVLAQWRTSLTEQVAALVGENGDLSALALEGAPAVEILDDAMSALAIRAGQSLQREAEKQGVDVGEWSLPDDVVTAAVGGKKLLRSVAQMTSDLMASSMVQRVRRTVLGMLTRQQDPQQIADEIGRVLSDEQEQLLKGPVGTAMSTAQTAGRQAVLEAAPPGEYYASEVLDRNTCSPCKAVDGEQFGDLERAIKAYPVMGYKDCIGSKYGNPCRGMIIARWQTGEDEAQTASAVTLPPSAQLIEEDPVPWHTVQNHSGCDAGQWAVIKDADGTVAGCHDSEADANDQMSALYASEGDATMTTETLKQGDPNQGTKKDKRLKENQYADMENDCPPGMEPDQQTGKCVEMAAGTQTLEIQGPAPEDIGGENTAPWRGPLTVEGIETGDGREFDTDSLTWADMPLPLRWNKEDSHGGDPHTVAVNVGRIDKIWREDNGLIMGEGLLDLSDDDGKKVHAKIEGKFLRGVSVDVDSVKGADMELVWPDQPDGEGDDPDPFMQMFAEPEKVVFHKGRIRAATLVDIPAFAEAYIALLNEEGAVVAGGEPIGALRAGLSPRHRSFAVAVPSRAPVDWFANPDLSVPTGITVTADGRVYGHAALWGTCHIGQAGVCVTPPQEDSHPYFMTGNTWTEDGGSVSVGQITVGTGHAPLTAGHRAASDHYDNTGAAVADVAVGNDAHGIWVAGSIRPGASAERVHELRAAGQVSGDWRRIGGQLRLVGLLAVNVPGFPVPKLRTTLSGGHQLALVAAGMPNLTEQLTEDELDQLAYRRIMSKLDERVHGKG